MKGGLPCAHISHNCEHELSTDPVENEIIGTRLFHFYGNLTIGNFPHLTNTTVYLNKNS